MSRLTWQNVAAAPGAGPAIGSQELVSRLLAQSFNGIGDTLSDLQDTRESSRNAYELRDARAAAEALMRSTYSREDGQRALMNQERDPERRARIDAEFSKVPDSWYTPSEKALQEAAGMAGLKEIGGDLAHLESRANLKLGSEQGLRLYMDAFDGRYDGFNNPMEYALKKVAELDGGEDADQIRDGIGRFQTVYNELRDSNPNIPQELIATVLMDSMDGTWQGWLGDSQLTLNRGRAQDMIGLLSQEGMLDRLEGMRQGHLAQQGLIANFRQQAEQYRDYYALANDRGDTATAKRALAAMGQLEKQVDALLGGGEAAQPTGGGIPGGEGNDALGSEETPTFKTPTGTHPRQLPERNTTGIGQILAAVLGGASSLNSTVSSAFQRQGDGRKIPHTVGKTPGEQILQDILEGRSVTPPGRMTGAPPDPQDIIDYLRISEAK